MALELATFRILRPHGATLDHTVFPLRHDLSSSCCLATPSPFLASQHRPPTSRLAITAIPSPQNSNLESLESKQLRGGALRSCRAASQEGAWATSASVQTKATNGSFPLLMPLPRRLILLRHAKSSWDDPSLKDHERPLALRGKKAAKRIAVKLLEEGWLPELILCSDSTRTRQTLAQMCSAVPALDEVPVKFLGSYYSVAAMDGQTAIHLQETVVKYAGLGIETVLCMGHNRGWEEAASEFAGEEVELKTAYGALLESEKEHSDWATAFADGGWRLQGILMPAMTVGS